MKSSWIVSPQALARARIEQLLSQEQLAKKSGVSPRSIRAYERKAQSVRLETLQLLAQTLCVGVKDLASVGSSTAKTPARSSASSPATETPSSLPPRTPLETLVDLERAAGIVAAKSMTPRGEVETLTAKRLQDVFTAYALHEGARFRFGGKVDGMRGVGPAEATLLGSRGGVAARFHIVRDVVPGQPIGVTVHTAGKDETAKLQRRYSHHATVLVRVVLVPGEPRDDGPGFTSFITRITAKRPWAFVVEEVTEGEGEAGEAAAEGEEGRDGEAERAKRARGAEGKKRAAKTARGARKG